MVSTIMRRLFVLATFVSASQAGQVVMDASGSLKVHVIPSSMTSQNLVAIISSPDTPSSSTLAQAASSDKDCLLSVDIESQESPCLTCRGPTLALKPSDSECASIAVCSLTAAALVLDGITEGDVEAGLKDSRHAVTLTALFRAKVALGGNDRSDTPASKQALLLHVSGQVSDSLAKEIKSEVISLYSAAAAEKDMASFDKVYELQVISSASQKENELMASILNTVRALERTGLPLNAAIQEAYSKIQKSAITSGALDPPQIASAFVAVGDAHSRQARSARAKFASWRSRAARGLLVDGFGKEAKLLRQRTLSTFDAETLSAAGLPSVAAYRSEMKKQLQTLVDSAIKELFFIQESNLEKRTMKRLRAKLLRHVNNNDMAEATEAIDNNAAALRAATFAFETSMADLEVPVLGLYKDKPVRDMAAKLNDELMTFPDSAPAKLKRAEQVNKVVSKERKPSQRAIDFGLDLVAMLRPDGFGSLQGFAGYQLGGNSLTFGVHNDADDPQVIAQFGGVRPPLLRVQPKLRVDVEV